jgi:hypothetical protein
MWGGSNSISSVSFPVADSVTIGARGAINATLDGVAQTYNQTTRTLILTNSAAGIAAAGGQLAETVVTGAVRTVTSGNRYFFTTSTNVTLSASLTGGQVVNLAKINNTATNSISAIGQVGWEWTGGVMTNTITAGKSMTFGFLVDPSNGKTNAYVTGVSN